MKLHCSNTRELFDGTDEIPPTTKLVSLTPRGLAAKAHESMTVAVEHARRTAPTHDWGRLHGLGLVEVWPSQYTDFSYDVVIREQGNGATHAASFHCATDAQAYADWLDGLICEEVEDKFFPQVELPPYRDLFLSDVQYDNGTWSIEVRLTSCHGGDYVDVLEWSEAPELPVWSLYELVLLMPGRAAERERVRRKRARG